MAGIGVFVSMSRYVNGVFPDFMVARAPGADAVLGVPVSVTKSPQDRNTPRSFRPRVSGKGSMVEELAVDEYWRAAGLTRSQHAA